MGLASCQDVGRQCMEKKRITAMARINQSFEERLDSRFLELQRELSGQIGRIVDAQQELKLEVRSLAGRIKPIEDTLEGKVSQESYIALEQRVAKLENAPSSVRSWLTLGASIFFSTLTACLGAIYFLVNFAGK